MNGQPLKERDDLISLQEKIALLMREEVNEIRRILDFTKREETLLVQDQVVALQETTQTRGKLFTDLLSLRERRKEQLRKLEILSNPKSHSLQKGESMGVYWDYLLQETGESTSALLLLRDQLVALMEAVQEQNQLNQSILSRKLQQTKRWRQQLSFHLAPPTYGRDGRVAPLKKCKLATLQLFDREG